MVFSLDIRNISKSQGYRVGYFVAYTYPIQGRGEFTGIRCGYKEYYNRNGGNVFQDYIQLIEKLFLCYDPSSYSIPKHMSRPIYGYSMLRREKEYQEIIEDHEDKGEVYYKRNILVLYSRYLEEYKGNNGKNH